MVRGARWRAAVHPLDATRRSYGLSRRRTGRWFGDELAGKPPDRALPAALAETVCSPGT